MKKLLYIILTLFVIATFACKRIYVDDCSQYDYSDCDTWEPYDAVLTVRVTINNKNPKVPITMFYGNFENNDTAIVDTLTKDTEYYVPIDKKYSVLAKYKTDNGFIYALDGAEVKKSSQNVCDSTCWFTTDDIADCRLK